MQMGEKNKSMKIILWVSGVILWAAIMFAAGVLIVDKLNQPKEEAVQEEAPQEESAKTTPVVTEAANEALPQEAASEANQEIIIAQSEVEAASQGGIPSSIDGVTYQADVYEYLTVRDAPNTAARAICLLPPFAKMQIIEDASDPMVKIYIEESGIQGYVNQEYITPAGAVTARAGKTPSVKVTDATIYYADVNESLTLRSAASTSASTVALLPPYTALQVIERSGKMAYVYVLDSGLSGWVNSEYITSNPNHFTRAGKVTQSGFVVGGHYRANVNEFLTLRDAPSTTGNEITKLAKGSVMVVLEVTNSEFCYVEVHGNKGYVMSKYLVSEGY